MENTTMQNYLTRSKLDATFIVKEDEILIQTASTTYVHARKSWTEVTKEEILCLMREVKQQAKALGIKLRGESVFKKTLEENYEGFCSSIRWANQMFENAADYARYIEARGLHAGTSDDKDLNNLMYNIQMIEDAANNDFSARGKVEKLYKNLQYLQKSMESFVGKTCVPFQMYLA